MLLKIWIYDLTCIILYIPGTIHRLICDVTHNPARKPGQQQYLTAVTFRWFGFHITMLTSSCYKLKGIVPNMVLCYCSPSPLRLSELSIQRCPSAHHCCTELLFAWLWASCYIREVSECGAAVSEVLKTPSGNNNCTKFKCDYIQHLIHSLVK